MKLRHVLHEIAEFGPQNLSNYPHYDDLKALRAYFNELNAQAATSMSFTKELFKDVAALATKVQSSEQPSYQGITQLTSDQTVILDQLKQRLLAYTDQDFPGVDNYDFSVGGNYLYTPKHKLDLIEELLAYVVNASLALDSDSNSKQLAYLYKALYEPIQGRIVKAIEKDRAQDRRNPLAFANHRIKRKFESDVSMQAELMKISNTLSYIVSYVFNGPSKYTNMSVDFLIFKLNYVFSRLTKQITDLYKKAPTSEDNPEIFTCLEYIDRIIEQANVGFARRYDATTQIDVRAKVEHERKTTKRALVTDQSVVVDPQLMVPDVSKYMVTDSQYAQANQGKSASSTALAQVYDLEYDGGLSVSSIADMMTMMMQSYDRGDEAKISGQSAVTAHFAAIAQVLDPIAGFYRDYVVTANKGRFTGKVISEESISLDGTKTERNRRELDEDGGQSFIVHFLEDVKVFKVEPVSARYFGNNDIPDVHVKEFFKQANTTSFVLSVNEVVFRRMNHIDIENHLTDRYRYNSTAPCANLIADEVRKESYKRYHKEELAQDEESFERGSKNIMVAASEITNEPKHLYFNVIANFPDGVRLLENSHDALLKTQEQLNQLVAKRDEINITVVNDLPEVENIPVPEALTNQISALELAKLGGKKSKKAKRRANKISLKQEKAKKILLAEQLMKFIDDVTNMAHLNNADSLEKSLHQFKKLLQNSLVNNPNSQKMLQKVYTAVYLSLNAMTSTNLIDKRRHFDGARIALADLNNMTQIYTKQDRVLAVVMSALLGIVIGTVLAVVLAATAVMPAAIVGALTVAGWVATMAAPLGILSGALTAYGIYGRHTDRARREAITMQKDCANILEGVQASI